MIFRVTRSVFARYGRPATILFAITRPMPGSESRSSALAVLMSIRPPFLSDAVDPVVPLADFGEELVWAAASVTAVKIRSSHRPTFIEAILSARSKQQFPSAQVNKNEEAAPCAPQYRTSTITCANVQHIARGFCTYLKPAVSSY
jgi:hypothetical protein